MFCVQCQKDVVRKESLKKKVDGTFMIRAECPLCGRWIRWIPYADSTLVKQAISFFSTLPENEGLTHD